MVRIGLVVGDHEQVGGRGGEGQVGEDSGWCVLGKPILDAPSAPPGWRGAKSVMSYTVPSTTIQRSSGLLCRLSSEGDTFLAMF